MVTSAGKSGGYPVQWTADCQSENQLFLSGPSELYQSRALCSDCVVRMYCVVFADQARESESK